jgi:putative redox protein
MAARHPKSFVSLDRADHLLTDPRDSLYVGVMIAAWAQKYIDVPPEASRKSFAADYRVMARTGKAGFMTEITTNAHRLIADEPISFGGTNLGPTPYDYLVAGLGACTSMTLRMYADRKGWPLEAAVVRLKHAKIHAADCGTCETQSGKIDRIDREIDLIGPLDGPQRERLLEIADRCPVHRTLHSEILITSKLTDK